MHKLLYPTQVCSCIGGLNVLNRLATLDQPACTTCKACFTCRLTIISNLTRIRTMTEEHDQYDRTCPSPERDTHRPFGLWSLALKFLVFLTRAPWLDGWHYHILASTSKSSLAPLSSSSKSLRSAILCSLELDSCLTSIALMHLILLRCRPSKCIYPYALEMLSFEARLARLISSIVI